MEAQKMNYTVTKISEIDYNMGSVFKDWLEEFSGIFSSDYW